MFIGDTRQLGLRLLAARKRMGLTQAAAAEAAGLSDRAYADIERGTANMRVETLLRICGALHLTPDELLVTDDGPADIQEETILRRLSECSPGEKKTALTLVQVYLDSLG